MGAPESVKFPADEKRKTNYSKTASLSNLILEADKPHINNRIDSQVIRMSSNHGMH